MLDLHLVKGFQSLLDWLSLIKILGVVHPSGAFFSPARLAIRMRSLSKLNCNNMRQKVKYLFLSTNAHNFSQL